MSFLKIQNLSVDYKLRKETVHAAKDINIEIKRGEIVGLVGESGSGKSTVANAIIDLIDEPGKVSEGSIYLSDINIHENYKIISPFWIYKSTCPTTARRIRTPKIQVMNIMS